MLKETEERSEALSLESLNSKTCCKQVKFLDSNVAEREQTTEYTEYTERGKNHEQTHPGRGNPPDSRGLF